jgi:hypothetical protein
MIYQGSSSEQFTTFLRQMANSIGIIEVVSLLLAGALGWLVVDYAHMLLLRRKMVSLERRHIDEC